MSIEKITARILQDARSDADALKKGAEEEAAAAMETARMKAGNLEMEMAARAKKDAAVLLERKNSVAELEARKMRLAAKQELIEESFAKAMEELNALPDSEYKAFLLAHMAPYHEGEVILNARDKKRLGRELAEALKDSGLTVSEDTADIQGGFILRQGNVSMNGSLEAILDGQKKQITAEIAKVLFS
ncbi:MAG: V-type ATP synthase subunit E [Clostridiales bacterium]|nr:V-type ATP synthase subunit E [Clostridiales bacterium]